MSNRRLNNLRIIFSGIVFFLLLYSSVSAQTRDSIPFFPDRPGMATPTNIMPRNIWEVEESVQYEKYSDDVIRNQNYLFSSVLLRYGLSGNAELRIQTDYAYNITDGANHSVVQGLDPITIGTKVKLLGQQRAMPNFSLLFNLTLPYAGKNEFRPDNAAPSFYLLMSNILSERVSLCYNYGIKWDGSSSVPTHFYAACLGVILNDKLSIFIEGYGYFKQTAKPKFYIDGGIAYLITENLQADFTLAGYLNSFKNYYLLNIGMAWEIDN